MQPPTVRRLRGPVAVLTAAALSTGALLAVTTAPAHAAAVPTLSPLDVPGRGATVPFKEQEAEFAATNGTVIGPERRYGTLPSEASGRQAVTLNSPGQYVEFTLTAPADAMSFRYSLPDSADGRGRDASIGFLLLHCRWRGPASSQRRCSVSRIRRRARRCYSNPIRPRILRNCKQRSRGCEPIGRSCHLSARVSSHILGLSDADGQGGAARNRSRRTPDRFLRWINSHCPKPARRLIARWARRTAGASTRRHAHGECFAACPVRRGWTLTLSR